MNVEAFLNLRQKVLEDIRSRLEEIAALAENATLILSKKAFKSIDLQIIETIVRLVDFKFSSIYSNTDFIEVITVDTKMWLDIKRNIIEKLKPLIEMLGQQFSRLSTTMEAPEILMDEDKNTAGELKSQLRDTFTDILRKIRELGKYTPQMLSKEEIEKKLKELYS